MKTYTESQIRDAFFATFRGVGEIYFPTSLHSHSDLNDELNAVENEYEDFLMHLERISK